MAPSNDAYVNAASASQNFGQQDWLLAGSVPGYEKVTYLKFDVPVPRSGGISSAVLILTRTNHHLSSRIDLRSSGSNWVENTLTELDAPVPGALLGSVDTDASTTDVSYYLDPADVATGSTMSLQISSGSTNDTSQFFSSRTANGPRLVLTYGEAPTPEPAGPCALSAKLVPACGRLFGSAPRALMPKRPPVIEATAIDEAMSGRTLDIVHQYHVNRQVFPTPHEVALATEPGRNRLLMENWKPATSATWAQIAGGAADSVIDAEASYINRHFPYRFFLAINHEPENEVVESPGSGQTALDYRAMYRHVALRLRADGVDNAVFVMNYMGYTPWAEKGWFAELYPGDDVVDWVAIDPYVHESPARSRMPDFESALINRPGRDFPGFYDYLTALHPGMPIMLGEWGVFTTAKSAGSDGKAGLFASAAEELDRFPMLKALVLFDMPVPRTADAGDTSPDTSPAALAAWRALANDSRVVGPVITTSISPSDDLPEPVVPSPATSP